MYLFKVKIDEKVCVYSAFSKIYGVGKLKNKKIIAILGCRDSHKLSQKLLDERLGEIERRLVSETQNIELELYRREYYDIKKYIDNGSLRGFCHKNGMPTRFQRTHTNAKTQAKLFKDRLELRKW